MKIAILSMQRVINYGSFLQAYSLKMILESMGHEVDFLDIMPGRKLSIHDNAQNSQKINIFEWVTSKFDAQILKRIYKVIFSIRFRNKFERKWQPMLGISKRIKYETNAETVVIGSDEVFNFAQKSSWGFSTQLFGEDINVKNKFSYAASFGFSTFSDAKKEGIISELNISLRQLNAISVRDKNSSKIIQKIIGTEPLIHIDPTLVYEFQAEIPDLNIPYRYLLLYSYESRTNSEEEVNVIMSFAKDKNLKVISIGTYHHWCDKNIIVNPFEALAYFKNASYVVTDTFHGTIFSIINKKKFCTIVRNSNSEKLHSLLNQFHLQQRELTKISILSQVLEEDINYSLVDEIIAKERTRSLQYLTKCIINQTTRNKGN